MWDQALPSWALAALPIGLIILPITYLATGPFRSKRQSSSLSISSPPSSTSALGPPLPSILAPAYTTHARLLPIPAKHAFSYPLLYLGADIDSLESGELDLPYRVLKYGGVRGRVLGVRSAAYLTPDGVKAAESGATLKGGAVGSASRKTLRARSMREKVLDLLREYGLGEEEVGRIWVLTMPSFLGFEGINPLTVWYIYRRPSGSADASRTPVEDQERGELLAVILEVHNTFGEKHAYVLPTSSPYVVTRREGYSHAWTFPRAFHVSPFNSRDGYYTLDLLDPFLASFPSITPASSDAISDHSVQLPTFKVFLRLLTPSRQTKLHALLASSPSPSSPPVLLGPHLHASSAVAKGETRIVTSTALAVLRTLARWPFALLATTPRILYQAYRLHYERRLAVYPRPEPGPALSSTKEGEGGAAAREEPGMGVGDEKVKREEGGVGQDEVEVNSGKGIGWQGVGELERMARGVVERYLRCRLSDPASIAGQQVHNGSAAATRGLRVEFTCPAPAFQVSSRPANAQEEALWASGKNDIVIRTADPKFFTHLLLFPSTDITTILFPEFGTLLRSEDRADFTRLLSLSGCDSAQAKTVTSLPSSMSRIIDGLADRIRRSFTLHLFAHSTISPEPSHMSSLPTLTASSSSSSPFSSKVTQTSRRYRHFSQHPLTPIMDRFHTLVIIALAAFADWAEERIMHAIGARFVDGQEPWKVWERALRRMYTMQAYFGMRRAGSKEGVDDDWELTRSDSRDAGGDSPSSGTDGLSGGKVESAKADADGDWVDLGSVLYT